MNKIIIEQKVADFFKSLSGTEVNLLIEDKLLIKIKNSYFNITFVPTESEGDVIFEWSALSAKVKAALKSGKSYDINFLNTLANFDIIKIRYFIAKENG